MGTTPEYELPYPEPTDWSGLGASNIQDLAEQTEFQFGLHIAFSIFIPDGSLGEAVWVDFGRTYAQSPLVVVAGWNDVQGAGETDETQYVTGLFGGLSRCGLMVLNTRPDKARVYGFIDEGDPGDVTIKGLAWVVPTFAEPL